MRRGDEVNWRAQPSITTVIPQPQPPAFTGVTWLIELVDMAPEYLYFLAFRDDPALHEQFADWGYLEAAAHA